MVYDRPGTSTGSTAIVEQEASAACLFPGCHFLNFLESQKWNHNRRGKASAGRRKLVGDTIVPAKLQNDK